MNNHLFTKAAMITTNNRYPDATFDYLFGKNFKIGKAFATPTEVSDHREGQQESLTVNRGKRRLPGLQILMEYQAAWFARDLMAGLVLTTMLVPVGIAYALASPR